MGPRSTTFGKPSLCLCETERPITHTPHCLFAPTSEVVLVVQYSSSQLQSWADFRLLSSLRDMV